MIFLPDEDIGYAYLAEKTSPEDNVVTELTVKKEPSGVEYADFLTILHTFRCMNRNIRQYYGPNLDECIKTERIQSMLHDNAWYGEMDHPLQMTENGKLTMERVRTIFMGNRSHKIMEPRRDGDILRARIQTASGSENGMGFYREIIQGLVPSFSCRSIAVVGKIDGQPYVIVKYLVTYDWVLYPSHKEAKIQGNPTFVNKQVSLITESAAPGLVLPGKRSKFTEDVMIPLTQLLDVTAARDDNVKLIMESFDLTMDDLVGFDKNLTHAIITDRENTLFIRVSPKTTYEVKDYLSSFRFM